MTSADGGDRTVAKVDPLISAVSALRSVTVGWQSASFTVTATAYPSYPLNYQWRREGINIVGATGATFNLGPAQLSQTGGYTVVVQTHGRNGQYNPHLHILATSGD
jgi:hypothetical protein